MAKRPTVSTISTGHASITALNNNFTALRDGFDNTLSRDGSTPNTMSADIDLNGNDITNVNTITNASGVDVVAAAAASATAAAASQAAAATSATAAAASQTAAAASQTAAASSQTAAASSATSAASTYDTFDDRFLGAKSSNPSVDNDGDALATGALYFNTTDDNMRVWNGSAWQAVGPTTTEQTNINTVAGIAANVTTVAGIDSAVTTTAQSVAILNSLNAMFTAAENIAVTVVNDGGNKFAFNGVTAPAITLVKGFTYTFDVSDSSVSGHPLAFKDSGGNAYTTGVTTNGTAGSSGANVVIAVPTTGTMPARYYCTTHGNGMGNTIATQANDIATVADSTTISNINTVVNNLSTISAKATVDEATALAIALCG